MHHRQDEQILRQQQYTPPNPSALNYLIFQNNKKVVYI